MRGLPGLLVAFALASATVAVPTASADDTTLYAYATSTTSGLSSCPQSTKEADQCTLAEALSLASAGDTVYLATAEGTDYVGNWTVSTVGTSAGEPLSIEPAPGLTSGPVLSGNAGATSGCSTPACDGSILTIEGADVYLNISDIQFIDAASIGDGGAIDNAYGDDAGTVNVSKSTFADNTAVDGGAIDNGSDGGSLLISDSTFDANTATQDGGAIDNADDGGTGTLVLQSSTLIDANAGADGYAIDNAENSGTGTVWTAGNIFNAYCQEGAGSTWNDEGYNAGGEGCMGYDALHDVDQYNAAAVDSLAENGGLTETMLPSVDNAALGAVPDGTAVTLDGQTVQLCSRADQRGFATAVDEPCTPGAVEPVLFAGSGPAATVAASYSEPLTIGGGRGPYSYTLVAGPLPTGLTLNGSSGVISGTPTQAGSFPVEVSVTDSYGDSGTDSFAFTANQPSVSLAPGSLPGATDGVAYDRTVTGAGGTAPYTYSITSGTLPDGLSLDPTTGAISGTPTAAGSFPFTIKASDSSTGTGAPFSGQRSYTLNVPTRSGITTPPARSSCDVPDHGPLTATGISGLKLMSPRSKAPDCRATLHAGFASNRLVRQLKLKQSSRYLNRLVWLTTTSRNYSVAGIRPGERLSTARERLAFGRPFPLDHENWYLVVSKSVTDLLGVTNGRLRAVGVAVRSLSDGSHAEQRMFLTAFV